MLKTNKCHSSKTKMLLILDGTKVILHSFCLTLETSSYIAIFMFTAICFPVFWCSCIVDQAFFQGSIRSRNHFLFATSIIGMSSLATAIYKLPLACSNSFCATTRFFWAFTSSCCMCSSFYTGNIISWREIGYKPDPLHELKIKVHVVLLRKSRYFTWDLCQKNRVTRIKFSL